MIDHSSTHIKSWLIKVTAVFAVLFLCIGCEESFDPVEENERYFFSIYGHLDSSADTQWVRIMPIRESIEYSTDQIDAIVTLRNLNTGEQAVLNDSLFTFFIDGIEDPVAVWNFWTTMDIPLSSSFELIATNSEGKSSTVLLSTPSDFQSPRIEEFSSFDFVYVSGIEHLADFRIVWTIYNSQKRREEVHSIPYTRSAILTQDGEYRIQIDLENDTRLIANRSSIEVFELEVLDTQILIASAGDEWIDFFSFNREVIALPEITSNIVNGLGYMVGTVIKIVPYEICVDEDDRSIPCPNELSD